MKGTTIYLVHRNQIGVDDFNMPVYSEGLHPSNDVYPSNDLFPCDGTILEAVDDCLVGQPSADDVANAVAFYGKKIAYTVGIPKGDSHEWTDAEVEIWGERFRTIGYPETGIQANIPLRWGQNIKVERYG